MFKSLSLIWCRNMKVTLKTKVDICRLNQKQIIWILLSVIIAVFPHLPRLPLWFPLLLISAVSLRWFVAIKKIKPLPPMLVALLTIVIFIAIIFFQGLSLNREISVTLLATMTVLKLLETWQKRDAWMVVTLCYFVILTRFFYSQDLLLVLYLITSVFVITHTLFILQHDNEKNIIQKNEIKQTLGLLAAGIPLAALFFIFFPRLGSPIWGSPDLFGQGKTGMSDEMSPGSISQLFSDDSTAFRVDFFNQIPKKNEMYWRGPVLWDFDGKTWRKNNLARTNFQHRLREQTGLKVSYEIEIEPTGQHYLFALDYIAKKPTVSKLLSDNQLISPRKINQLSHYKAISVIKKYNNDEYLSSADFNRLKSFPPYYNPKTQQLMLGWKQQNLSTAQYIAKALNWFATDEFYYSYTPPRLQGDTIDEFLFGSKKGFCEHYASSFTIMMRMLGIPARVVTGYQGGVQNKDYWLVKQSDAHAWSEVWIKGKGWLRVDPTAAVSPLRIEKGSQALMSQQSRNWIDSSWTRKLGEQYDAIRYKWNKWVRDYNSLKQQAIFKFIGFEEQNGRSIAIVLGLITLITTLFVLIFLYFTRPIRKLGPYGKIYNKFLKLCKLKGLIKPHQLGIVAFSQKACSKFPQAEKEINSFTQLYLRLRFGKNTNKSKTLDKKLIKILDKIKAKLN
ncbi:MAG TPA: DUF3488 domain-containing protein [Oceanospirillales bacterium]|nr:DUF3488 domain-containing protein [Oceanospirillales bacterium]